ncbi:MAG: hypothetical protein PUJ90_10590 [Streptococcus suis]|nr:hypothetical protein [Streptococcus suis]
MNLIMSVSKSEKDRDYAKLFDEKCDYLLKQPYGFRFSEIYLADFFDYVFVRDSREEPFEETLSKEYQAWRKKKQDWVVKLHKWQKDHKDSREEFREKICYEDMPFFRYNPIAIEFKDEKTRDGRKKREHTIITKENPAILERLEGRKFVIASPITYVGRNRNAANARYLYAFAFDLDGVGMAQIRDCLFQMLRSPLRGSGEMYQHSPVVNVVVNSGHGLHLYYLLKTPIPLYKENQELLNRIKHNMTNLLWNEYTSSLSDRQYQGIFQGFRLPGTQTKFGKTIRAFYNEDSHFYTIDELNEWAGNVLTEKELNQLKRHEYHPDGVTLSEAERRWPEWYERVVIQGIKQPKQWHIKRDLYDWWLNRLRNDQSIIPGHRYFCLMALAAYAIKCDIDFDELKSDTLSLVVKMEKLTNDEDNHFTEQDALDALQAYKVGYCTFPKNSIEYLTGLRMPEGNRRNGRTQEEHLKRARVLRDLDYPDDSWINKEGRPKGSVVKYEDSRNAKKIAEWRKNNPESHNKSACARDLGLSRPTIRKWWNK